MSTGNYSDQASIFSVDISLRVLVAQCLRRFLEPKVGEAPSSNIDTWMSCLLHQLHIRYDNHFSNPMQEQEQVLALLLLFC